MTGPLFKGTPGRKIPMIESYQNLRLKTRAACFFFDKDEYKDEIKDYKHAGKVLAYRTNLRMAIVTSPKLIKQLKKMPSTVQFFPDIGYSSCVVRRYDGQYVTHDISSSIEPINFEKWIQKNSKKPVDLLDNESIQIQQTLGSSMFLTFVDFDSNDKVLKASQKAIAEVEKVEKKFGHLFAFFYCPDHTWGEKKRLLGITWDTLPAMAFNMLDQTVIPYPKHMQMDSESIMPWFENIILRKDTESTKFRTDHINVIDPNIYDETLFHTTKLVRNNYTDYLADEGQDDILFLYTTSVQSAEQREQAEQFN